VKHSIWGLIVLIFVIGAAIGFALSPWQDAVSTPTPTPHIDDVVCTQEARECPDGSFVGRTGPACEFEQCPDTRRVQLFYYDAQRDMGPTGNLLCSAQGLVGVVRDIAVTKTPIGDTIRLLMRGELTADEMRQGISTEFPLAGLSLVGASIRDQVLTLSFRDLGSKTSGGSCRVSILRAQIEATAKQFEEVTEVRFAPADVFQP
jgi:hypothetical protein